MPADPIDAYLETLDEPARSTLDELRSMIRELLPDAQECLAYGVPGFRVDGRLVAGFAAFTRHLSYLPHSGTVLRDLSDEVAGYSTSKGALQFQVDSPLPRSVVEALVRARLGELGTER